jgi:hypothetical protein
MITISSQKYHKFFTSRGIGKDGALIRRRMMKKGKLIAISYFTGMAIALLVALVFSSLAAAEGVGANFGVSSAVAVIDLEAKAEAHENAAREMQARAQEQKRLLEQYKAKSYLYRRQAQDLQGHTHALARKYDKAAKDHAREAALHRERAIQLAEDAFCNFPAKAGRC